MNNHTLKKIAELLGYDVFIAKSDSPFKTETVFIADAKLVAIEFNPKDNPEQLLECEDYLLKLGWHLSYQQHDKTYLMHWYGILSFSVQKNHYGRGETLADAVLNATEELA